MNTEQMTTDQAATTTEGQPESPTTDEILATGAESEGQQHLDESTESTEAEGEATEEAKADGAPEEYEFKAGEGLEFDDAVIEQFSEAARELDLSQDKAQAMLDKMAPVLAARQAEQIAAAHEQWAETSKADTEFGGDKLNESLGHAKRAMDEYASPELRTLLNESGMGNHPEVIRMFVRVGKTIGEDGIVTGSGPRTAARDGKSFYPNSKMN